MHKKLIYFFLIVGITSKVLAQNSDTFYIEWDANTGAPQMPRINFDISRYESSSILLYSKSEHKKRGKKDDIKITPSQSIKIWDINRQLGNKIFGGTMIVKNTSTNKVLKELKIRGKNPDDALIEKYIKANCKEHWYAYAIARHESRQRFYVFNQFNSSYMKPSISGIPNCGLPDGWGIMQIDSKRGSEITTDEVYDWRKNVEGGLAVMDKAKKEAHGYFNAVKRTFPDKWEEPPSSIILPGTKTRLSYMDACVIQLYNGASVVRRLKTAFGTYSYYRSSWEFDENASRGKRWKFKPNVNNYVYKVISHEVEGTVKSENEPLR